MRAVSDRLAAAITGSHSYSCHVDAYYDGQLVRHSIPISDGTLSIDGDQAVPGSLDLTLPRWMNDPDTHQRLDLLPTVDTDPLACAGSRLALAYEVALPGGGSEIVNLGWQRIESWDEDTGELTVAGASLEALLEEARFLADRSTKAGTGFAAAFADLVGGLLPTHVTADPARVTASLVYEEDRLDALSDLMAAWPARMYVDDTGTLVAAPPFDDATDPIVLELTDGEGGTLVSLPHAGTRDGVYNAVRASGEQEGEAAAVSATAYLRTGPRRWGGPFGNVPYFYSSPLLSTKDQCAKAAATRLQSLQASAASVTVSLVPDPRLEPGDLIRINRTGEAPLIGRIDAITLPLVPSDAMTLRVHEITGRS